MAGMWLKRGWYTGGCRQDKDWVRMLRDGALTAQTAQLNKHSLSLDVTAVFRTFVSVFAHSHVRALLIVCGLARGLDAIYRHAAWNVGPWMDIIEGLIGSGNAAYEMNKAAKAGAVGIIVRRTKLEHRRKTTVYQRSIQNPKTRTTRG
ncbi:hypothetical protein N7504_001818 [Penicillium tannophilum]|nr:hypothetical protein N7504_001818 [Penicillium tannophilum]